MSKRKRFHCDEETGEIITFQINEETGEPAIINDIENFTFNLDKNPITCSFLYLQDRYVRKNKKIKTLKEQNTNGSILTSPRMFLLIATVMFIPSFMSAFLILLETFLHIGCHIRNKYLEDLNMYYLNLSILYQVYFVVYAGNVIRLQKFDGFITKDITAMIILRM